MHAPLATGNLPLYSTYLTFDVLYFRDYVLPSSSVYQRIINLLFRCFRCCLVIVPFLIVSFLNEKILSSMTPV